MEEKQKEISTWFLEPLDHPCGNCGEFFSEDYDGGICKKCFPDKWQEWQKKQQEQE